MITFAYPGYNPTVTIEMPSPDRDDPEVNTDQLFLHISKGGTFKTNIKRSCNNKYEKELNFSAVCESKQKEFLEFVKAASGHYIKYIDYNGKEWITQISESVITTAMTPFGYSINLSLLAWEAT